MGKKVKVWYDKEGDFLEVLFSDAPGYFEQSENDSLMERIDSEGNFLGFSILGVSSFTKEKPLNAVLELAN